MTLPMVTCPLCCRPGFNTSDALFSALVEVSSRKLSCPICNYVVSGLDKFTVHLFGHSNSQNNPSDIVNFKNDSSILIRNEENNSYTLSSSLLYLKTNSGQLYSISPNNSSSFKNLTITTRNYITNTNIRTPTQEKGQSPQTKPSSLVSEDDGILNNTAIINGNCNDNYSIQTKEFKSCKDLLTKGDFSTNSDDQNENKEDVGNNSIAETDSNTTEIENTTELKNNDVVKKQGDQFCCDICSYSFPNKAILAMHKQLVHKKMANSERTNRKPLLCNLCPQIFNLRSSLLIHRRVAHAGGFGNPDSSGSGKSSNLSCDICGKIFKKDNRDQLRKQCRNCGLYLKAQPTQQRETLFSEAPEITDNPVSDRCLSTLAVAGDALRSMPRSSQELQLTHHLKGHDDKQCQCTICLKTFTTKYFLKKHRRLHTGEMPYQCNICFKTFTFQQSYHKHLLYHNNEKPYCCSHCGRLFKELSTLHNHERIHSGEKPFSCETCGKAFRQRVSYLVHRRIHTGAMPYKCTTCNKSFRYKISQRTHKCTAQPPGVVVRTQGSLVQRLQAALKKVASSSDHGDKIESIHAKPANDLKPGVPHVNVVQNCSNDNSIEEIPTNTFEKECTSQTYNRKCAEEKRESSQLYLLVKGPDEETYYQPLLISQNESVAPLSTTNSQSTNSSLNMNGVPQILNENNQEGLNSCGNLEQEIKNQGGTNSVDIMSFLLSPPPSSSSEQIECFAFSPNSNHNERFSDEIMMMFSPQHSTEMPNDSNLLDKIADDALKEFLFDSQS